MCLSGKFITLIHKKILFLYLPFPLLLLFQSYTAQVQRLMVPSSLQMDTGGSKELLMTDVLH